MRLKVKWVKIYIWECFKRKKWLFFFFFSIFPSGKKKTIVTVILFRFLQKEHLNNVRKIWAKTKRIWIIFLYLFYIWLLEKKNENSFSEHWGKIRRVIFWITVSFMFWHFHFFSFSFFYISYEEKMMKSPVTCNGDFIIWVVSVPLSDRTT